MRRKLTQKQEQFALSIFEGKTQREAWVEAGYSTNYPIAHRDRDASLLANSPKILQRIEELRKRTEDASVMGVLERKQRLSEIGRAKLTDFMEAGQDGSWVNLGKETPQGGAVQEIHSRTEYDKDGAKPTVYTSVKLHDPMKAIDLLNKMDKIYSDFPPPPQDNRIVNIFVVDNEAKVLISQVAERTKQLTNGNAYNQGLQGDPASLGGEQKGDTA